MDLRERAARWFRPAVYLAHNPLTLSGAVLTSSSAVIMISFWAYEFIVGRPLHPYAGIIIFLILPGVFVFGLVLIPLGAWWRRRRLRAAGKLPDVYPRIDFREPVLRRGFALVVILTFLNVAILGMASYRAWSTWTRCNSAD